MWYRPYSTVRGICQVFRQDSIRQVLCQSSCDGPNQQSPRQRSGLMGIYNGLVVAANRFKNAFAQIDVQLKRRYELIPNLVEAVKGYMAHERETLDAVIKARNNAMAAEQKVAANPADPAVIKEPNRTENQLGNTLGRLFAL